MGQAWSQWLRIVTISQPLHAHLPEAMAFDLRETERFLDNLRAADVVLIGSGLGEDGVASQAMDLVLANIRGGSELGC